VQPVEIVFVLIALGLLVTQNLRGVNRAYPLALLAAGLVTLVLGAWFGPFRWQMAPAYLVFLASALLSLRQAHSHIALRSLGVFVGALLLAVSITLSVGLPLLTLPAPEGPHSVGTTSFSLRDDSRDESLFGAPDKKRELYVQAWHPAVVAKDGPEPRRRTLWSELHRGDLDRFTVFTRYLRRVETHSYEDVALGPAQATYPVIVFSHAMVSFAEQSTLLMEHLASHGYVVFAISHPYMSMRVVASDGSVVYPALEKVSAASAPFDTASAEFAAHLARAASDAERNRLQVERYASAEGLNELMAVWVADVRFALDAIAAPPGRYPQLQRFAGRIDAERIGLLGMSFGGGAITEVCKVDARCRAGLNIDGGTFGERQTQPLQVPFLGLVREGQSHLDYLLPASESDYYGVSVAGASHLDFTDDTVVLPMLKWLGFTGRIDARRVIEVTNAVSLRFFDAYLRDGPKPRFDEAFPELTVHMNDRARE
jgi:predicted dienelactone hydrolase